MQKVTKEFKITVQGEIFNLDTFIQENKTFLSQTMNIKFGSLDEFKRLFVSDLKLLVRGVSSDVKHPTLIIEYRGRRLSDANFSLMQSEDMYNHLVAKIVDFVRRTEIEIYECSSRRQMGM